jgi:ABC-type branched-subunit amino acid transport system substrate-binding protein
MHGLISKKSNRSLLGRRQFLVASGASLAALMCGNFSPAQSQQSVKIGFILPAEGPLADESRSLLAGFRLYLEEKKSGPFQVHIIEKNSGPDDEAALQGLAQLLAMEDVRFIVATPSTKGSEQIVHGVGSANRVLFVTNPSVRLVSGEMCIPAGFRVCSNTYQIGYPLGPWAVKNTGQTAFLCGEDSSEMNGIMDFFANGYERSGGVFVDRIMVEKDAKDFTEIIDAVKNSKADAVFAGFSGKTASEFLKAFLKTVPVPKQVILGPDSLTSYPDTVELIKGTNCSLITASPLVDPQEFVGRIKRILSVNVRNAARAAEGYDIARVILEAAQKVQGDVTKHEALVKAVSDITLEGGPRGKVSFDKNHEPVLEMSVHKWTISGQSYDRKTLENLESIKTPDLGCGRIGFPRRPESEIKDEDPVWEEKE